MQARDVMVRAVIKVHPDSSVADAIELLQRHDISALPVIDGAGNLVGILSEADLIHRVEIGTEKQRSWWLEAVTGGSTLAQDFAKSHGKKVHEVMMSGAIISAPEDAPLSDIATLLERNRIKRIPITRDGKLVGIVSRSNLIQALASAMHHTDAPNDQDATIRDEFLKRVEGQKWTGFGERNVIVSHGTVNLWGLVGSEEERRALIALAESVPGVTKVQDEMFPSYYSA
jgi:CBS domain-containing protein